MKDDREEFIFHLLDKVASGETTVEIAELLAAAIGVKWTYSKETERGKHS